MSKDLNGDLELHVKFVVFDITATRNKVSEPNVFSVIEELGNEIIQADTEELLEEVNVDVTGQDRTKIGGNLIIKIKYMGTWMMKVQKPSSLQNWKESVISMIQYMQRTHDHIRQGTETKSNVIKVYDEKIFGEEYD